MLPTDYTLKSTKLEAISVLLANESELLDFLLNDRRNDLRAAPLILMDEMSDFRFEQQLLIRIALDFWSGSGTAKLRDILAALDQVQFDAVLMGLECLRYKDAATEYPPWDDEDHADYGIDDIPY